MAVAVACLISFSFSTNPYCPQYPFLGTDIRRLTTARFVRPISKRTEEGKLILPNRYGRDVLPLNGSCQRDVSALARQFCEPFVRHFGASCSAHVLISGFWTGPDIEDGWGFVEAFVDPMY